MFAGIMSESEDKDEERFGAWIPLPPVLENQKALINVKNEDEECFKWCVARHFFREFHPERVTERVRTFAEKEFDWRGISFPVNWKHIDIFERNNDISVNVLGLEDKEIFIARKTRRKRDRHVNLFKFREGEKEHFCLVNSLSRLL